MNQTTVEELIKQNLAYATHVTKEMVTRHRLPEALYDDFLAAAREGLVRACKTHDPSKSTFRSWCYLKIRGSVLDEARRTAWLSVRTHRRLKKEIQHFNDNSENTLGHLGLNFSCERQFLRSATEAEEDSCAYPADEMDLHSGYLGQIGVHPEQEEMLARKQEIDEVRKAISKLGAKARSLIVAHYIEGKEQREIAAELGVTKAPVSKHMKRAVKQLRAILESRDVFSGNSSHY